jgi:hypothetical protein
LLIGSAMAEDRGNYFVVASNFAGGATSTVAMLTFDASALSILVPPKDVSVEAGFPARFTVLVSGIPPFSYQWEHNGLPISLATNSTLSLPSAGVNDGGTYDVIVSNPYRTVTSSGAVLSVTPGAGPPNVYVGRLANNLTITFSADAGQSYRLSSSTNLFDWSPVNTNTTVLAGTVQFVLPLTSAPRLFFRVQTP